MAGGTELESLVDNETALLATVLDQSHDCIELLSADGVILYLNRQSVLAVQLSSPAELIGQPYITRWPRSVRPRLEKALASARGGEPARFKASRPQSDGSPTWWDVTVSPIRSTQGSISHFVTIARDMTAEVHERERVEAISTEMRHRLKNALTVAAGIVTLSARERPEATGLAQEIIARLNQLNNVQALVLDPDADRRLARIVPALASAYGDGVIDFGNLPDIQLSDQAMQAVALCFGELATNSMKYGALRHGNRVHIDGMTDEGFIELRWREDTIFGEERQGGQGLSITERLVRTAGGTFSRHVEPGLMRATMRLPVE